MKKHLVIALALTTILGTALFSFELGADFRLGNLGFAADRAKTDTSMPGSTFDWGISIFAGQKISDAIRIDMGFYSDPILRNISYTTLTYVEGIMVITIGPLFGYLNSNLDPILKPGISAMVKLDFPSVFFASIQADSTLNTRLSSDRDYIQERTSVNAGFYVPNAICTLEMNQKKFTQIVKENEIDDSVLEFIFMSDIYKKNTPYGVKLGFGFQLLSKTFFTGVTTVEKTHTVGSIFARTSLDISITDAVFITVGADANIYTYGYNDLLAQPAPFFAFNSHAGVKINFDRFFEMGELEKTN